MLHYLNSTIAVIIAFNPDAGFCERCFRTLDEVGSVIVVDNGSSEAGRKTIATLADVPGIFLIVNDENKGLGCALNQGIRLAMSKGFQWICTLDQDSLMQPGFKRAMENIASQLDERVVDLGFLAPVYQDEKSGIFTSYASRPGPVPGCSIANETITSGNLVPASTFRAVGLFDEGLFIDYLDYDFSLRCRIHGKAIVEVSSAVLLHNLGNSTRHRLLGRPFFVTHHSALRRYYITRNRITLYARYFAKTPDWVMKDGARFMLDLFKVGFYESDRHAKLRSMMQGALHAFTGRRGPRPQEGKSQ
jgi:rhamnosyltransferase